MKDYSQFGEQKIILDYFKKIGQTTGNVLSIGENDGETLSNVRALILNGWTGMLFEPANNAHFKLSQLYKDNPNIHCEKFAIGTQTGQSDFYDSGPHVTENDSSLLSTLKETETLRWKGSKWDSFVKVKVDVITWGQVMSWEKCKGVKFDFINIDAEGMDLEILRQMNLEDLECKLLCIEYNGDLILQAKIRDYCASYGFKYYWSNSVNVMFYKA